MGSTRTSHRIRAPREDVYRALIDPEAIARWRFPEGMSCEVHSFDPREGGAFRVSLTYDGPTGAGKTSAQTDTYAGHIARLVPDREVVETIEFETDDPAMAGEMTMTTVLSDAEDGTEITVSTRGSRPASRPRPTRKARGWRSRTLPCWSRSAASAPRARRPSRAPRSSPPGSSHPGGRCPARG